MDRCDTFRAAQQKSARGVNVGSRQTDEETGHNKTRKHLARRMVKHVRELTAQSKKHGQKKKPKLDAARAKTTFALLQTMILVMKTSQTMPKETGNEGGDAMQSHHTSQSERFKLEAALCK